MSDKFTPHIEKDANFAETVLMPGDPKRSRYIAENFLEGPVLINDIRGVCGFTGLYKGKKVSVMASGMGMPSISIYSHELYEIFGVENIIRVGSIGALDKNLKLFDIVAAMSASTTSNIAESFGIRGTLSAACSFSLLKKCSDEANRHNITLNVGNILSSDAYYGTESMDVFYKMGMIGIEMEAYALYINAMRFKRNALALCTVSNIIGEENETTAKERESSFNEMITLALSIA